MKIKTAYVEVRSQHSVGSGSNTFGGPDTYVAVQIVPSGVIPLVQLQHRVAKHRGIGIKYFGQGYGRYRGSRSMLGQAIQSANEWAEQYNARQDAEFNQLVHRGE